MKYSSEKYVLCAAWLTNLNISVVVLMLHFKAGIETFNRLVYEVRFTYVFPAKGLG